MIDITVGQYNNVTVEGKEYDAFNDRYQLVELIQDIISRAKYSGESITLSTIKWSPGLGKVAKVFINEW